MDEQNDDFFVGYLPAPTRTQTRLRRIVFALPFACVVIASLIAARQRNPGEGKWDLEHPSSVEGVLIVDPYPILTTQTETLVVVSSGKHGAPDNLASFAGEPVKLSGHRIQRGDLTLLELDEENFLEPGQTRDSSPSIPISQPSRVELRGEIIDPKCYCGAMKPGDGKPHKACAVLCIRGGIPPAFVTADGKHFLIAGADGARLTHDELESLIPFVADPIEVRGQTRALGDLQLLTIDPTSIRRL